MWKEVKESDRWDWATLRADIKAQNANKTPTTTTTSTLVKKLEGKENTTKAAFVAPKPTTDMMMMTKAKVVGTPERVQVVESKTPLLEKTGTENLPASEKVSGEG